LPQPAGVEPPPKIPTAAGASLSLAADPTAKPGQEVGVAIVASPQLRAGQFDLVYDPAVLDGGGGGTPGRMTLKFAATGDSAMGTVIKVRFKPIASAPGETQVHIENIAAQDTTGSAVTVAAPPPQSMKITP